MLPKKLKYQDPLQRDAISGWLPCGHTACDVMFYRVFSMYDLEGRCFGHFEMLNEMRKCGRNNSTTD